MAKKASNSENTKTDAIANVEIREYSMPVSHGQNVRHYRKMKDFSQEYMASELGISQQRYSEIEKQDVIEDSTLEGIAKILGLNIEWLRDIPLPKGTTIYNQDGQGPNFQNTGDVAYTVNNPIDDVKKAYTHTIEILKENFDIYMKSKDLEIARAIKERDNYLERLLKFVDGIKS